MGTTTLYTAWSAPAAYGTVAKSLTSETLPWFGSEWVYLKSLVSKVDKSGQSA
jgi:hypothetical protein